MIYQTIYKIPFQWEKQPNATLTKSACKDFISGRDGRRDAGLCLKIKSVSERIFHCKLLSSAPICTALLVLVRRNKNRDTFSSGKQSIRIEVPYFRFVPSWKRSSPAHLWPDELLKLQDFDLKAALLPSGVAVQDSNQLMGLCLCQFLPSFGKLKTYKSILSLSGKWHWWLRGG